MRNLSPSAARIIPQGRVPKEKTKIPSLGEGTGQATRMSFTAGASLLPRTYSAAIMQAVSAPVAGAPSGRSSGHMAASSDKGQDPFSPHFDPTAVVLSAVLWWAVYQTSKLLLPVWGTYRRWTKSEQYQARSTIASNSFILLIIPMCVYALAADADLEKVRVVGSTPLSRAIIHLAAGYFLYDTLLVTIHMKQDGHSLQFIAHGFLCFVTYALAAAFDCYQYYGPVFLMFEFTGLFVNARWWFAKLEMKDSIAYAINGFSLLFAWLGVRLIFGIGQSARFWGDTLANRSEIPTGIMLWYTFSNVCLNSLNVFWFFKIVKSALSWSKPKKG